MRALVVYESMFGNTEAVARAVAEGISHHLEVDLDEVSAAPSAIPSEVVLLVVGGPTHARGMTTPRTRADAGRRTDGHLVSPGEGVREWLEQVQPSGSIAAAAFDTRVDAPAILTGSAARGLAKELVRAGFRLARPAHSFLVERAADPPTNRLADGELDRARAWGIELAKEVAVPARTG